MSSTQFTKVYVLDNGKSYSNHFIMFVEAVPSDFEPLWALYEKAWPRVCRQCGVSPGHNRCSVWGSDLIIFYLGAKLHKL